MTEIKFSPDAIDDLRQIKAYIAEELCSERAAVSTIEKIIKQIRTLAYFPESGAPLSSVIDTQTDYRFLVCSNYIAFYRAEAGAVRIVRILYGRRNYIQILFGEPPEN